MLWGKPGKIKGISILNFRAPQSYLKFPSFLISNGTEHLLAYVVFLAVSAYQTGASAEATVLCLGKRGQRGLVLSAAAATSAAATDP